MKREYAFAAKWLSLCICTVALTACSSSSSNNSSSNSAELPPQSGEGGQQGVFNPQASLDVFACEAQYYRELRGSYFGQVSYTAPNDNQATCTWEASLQVRGNYQDPADTRVCEITSIYSYTLTDGGDQCVDGSLTAPMDDPLAASPNRLDWESPEWPEDLPMLINPGIDDNAVIPAGTIAASARRVNWRFDGLDEALLLDDNDADGIVEGTLVKR